MGSVNIDRILLCPVLPSPAETVLETSVREGSGGKAAIRPWPAATSNLVAQEGRWEYIPAP